MRAVPILSLVFAITLYLTTLTMVDSRVVWLCKPCTDYADCETEPVDFCHWGETRNSCNRRVCAKGPGERCGGIRDIFGMCGTGMWCQVEDETNVPTCHGCYDNSLECHTNRRY